MGWVASAGRRGSIRPIAAAFSARRAHQAVTAAREIARPHRIVDVPARAARVMPGWAARYARRQEGWSSRSAGLQISFLGFPSLQRRRRRRRRRSGRGRAGVVPENETTLYRGQNFEIGHGPGFYGIWPAGAPRPASIEWWPDTPEGWNGAWTRFTRLEAPAPGAPGTSTPPPRLARARPSRLASAWRPSPPVPARAPSSRPRCSRPASSAGSPGFSRATCRA